VIQYDSNVRSTAQFSAANAGSVEVWDVTDVMSPFSTDFEKLSTPASVGTLARRGDTFYVVNGSSGALSYFTVTAAGVIVVGGTLNDTALTGQSVSGTASAIGVFGDNLLLLKNVRGVSAYNITDDVPNFINQLDTLPASALGSTRTSTYGALAACRWMNKGSPSKFAYISNSVPDVTLTDIAQGEVLTLQLDVLPSAPVGSTTSVTTTGTTNGAAATTGAGSTAATTGATISTTGVGATTGASATTGSATVTTSATSAASAAATTASSTTSAESDLIQVITLTYAAGTVITDNDISSLITRAGGDPSVWQWLITTDNNNKPVVVIVADADVVSAADARTLEAGIDADTTFQSQGGQSSVRTNVKNGVSALSASTVLMTAAAVLTLHRSL